MKVTLAALGTGTGLGLWSLVVWLFPPRPALSDLIARLRPEPQGNPFCFPQDGGWAARVGAPFTALLRSLGLPHRQTAKDLAIAERSADTHLAEKAALGLTGLVLPGAVDLLLVAGGRTLPWPVPASVALTLAVSGFLLPDVSVRTEARRRREALRHALSSYLNLIHILLAGGAGVDAALHDAARTGQGWAFQQLRRALNTARFTRGSPWSALGQLGEELEVPELTELAAALSLAGTEGAKMRASLSARAAAMRGQDGAAAEGRANAATERMALPGMLMAFGFVLFIFYPALTQITASL
ncbi:type II secretion system F family protein [Streptomyces sp. AN091965]|uniref:type II secretion system F family protein n=1 Tax=Streptomyces sp. AN091965 TaxID=2927803 RepID=UPI001F60072F|nr:type II secretion system F family protein [Streptomyces sp. AN091965]MCI3928830.1 type II secretion system F family protein [Streptomyces sp. AN091965]